MRARTLYHLLLWFLPALVGAWTPAVCPSAAAAESRAADLETSPTSINYLPLDEDVNEEIARIDRLTRERAWRKVIELCQKWIARPPRVVVRLRKDAYGSVRTVCEAKLRRLPEGARLLYRTLYDPEAEKLYRRARERRDLAAARRLVAEFALTSYGPPGLRLAADLLFDRGEVHAALQHWWRWGDAVSMDTVPEETRRRVAVKAAVAAARVGNRMAFRRALELFGWKGSAVEVGGRKVARADELKTLVASLWKHRPGTVLPAPAALDFVRWRRAVRNHYARRIPESYRSGYGTDYTVHGQISNGALFLNLADGPRCVDVLTGRTRWTRSARNFNTEYYYETIRSFCLFARVYSELGGPGRNVVFISGGSRLGAYDAVTGRALWTKSRASFGALDGFGNDRRFRVAFSSPVLCFGELAYVMVETSNAEVHLMALERATGRVRWTRNVGGSAPRSGYRVSFPSALVRVGSELVFCNGRGIIGKCDAATGDIRWLVPYRRRRLFTQGNLYQLSTKPRYSPLAVSGGLVVCVPSDGSEVIALRLAGGELAWRKARKRDERLAGTLPAGQGGVPDRLFLVGKEVLCLRADTGAVLWTWPVPEDGPVGLGCLTEQGVTFATHKALYVVDAASGELRKRMPLSLARGRAVGITSSRDALALVSDRSVTVVAGRQQTAELLECTEPHRRDDPWRAAVAARLLRAGGQPEAAATGFDEAIRLARKGRKDAALVGDLERELVAVYRALYRSDWKAGRRVEAFRRILAALHSPSRTPHCCKLGYRGPPAPDSSAPHTLLLASGDHLSGRLVGIESRTIHFVTGGERWEVAVEGVREVLLETGGTGRRREPLGGQYVVLSNPNADVISGRVVRLAKSRLEMVPDFGDHRPLRLRLSEVAVIAFGGTAPRADPRRLFVRLRNGDELSGRIRAFDGTAFLFDIPYCGLRRIPVETVYTIANRRRVRPASGTADGSEPTVGD